MVNAPKTLLPDYWKNYTPGKADLDHIGNYLFENEIPLTEKEIVPILIQERIRVEREALLKEQQGGGKIYLPEDGFQVGEGLTFPALDWQKGKVVAVRPGVNPTVGPFEVVAVEFEDGARREYASRLTDHKLNHPVDIAVEDESLNAEAVNSEHGAQIEARIAQGLQADKSLVQIAGRWFPRALLIDMNVGHLNLAEAILDEAGGNPLTTETIITQVGLPSKDNSKLIEFSMNYALQEDGRFDEVGPAGEVLWCLKRLEPADVQQIPTPLRYIQTPYDRTALTRDMLALEAAIDDELGESDNLTGETSEITVCLTYPHWRAGTLPVSARTRGLFPTAYESERVRFQLVDALSKEEMPAWVVRQHGYVAGLGSLYQKHGLIPGGLVTLRKGQKPGQVVIEARTRRPTKDWVRTVLVGSDGGIVFANLKQNLTCEINERMVVAVPDVGGVDAACEQIAKQKVSLEDLVKRLMQELTKLNVQGHIHAQELYSALNIVRRCPIAPLLAHLAQSSAYKHVGDLHYRLSDGEGGND